MQNRSKSHQLGTNNGKQLTPSYSRPDGINLIRTVGYLDLVIYLLDFNPASFSARQGSGQLLLFSQALVLFLGTLGPENWS